MGGLSRNGKISWTLLVTLTFELNTQLQTISRKTVTTITGEAQLTNEYEAVSTVSLSSGSCATLVPNVQMMRVKREGEDVQEWFTVAAHAIAKVCSPNTGPSKDVVTERMASESAAKCHKTRLWVMERLYAFTCLFTA